MMDEVIATRGDLTRAFTCELWIKEDFKCSTVHLRVPAVHVHWVRVVLYARRAWGITYKVRPIRWRWLHKKRGYEKL